MAKNITLKLDDAILRECKRLAFSEEKSVSQWVSEMIIANLQRKKSFLDSKAYALRKLRLLPLNGKQLTREEMHERRR